MRRIIGGRRKAPTLHAHDEVHTVSAEAAAPAAAPAADPWIHGSMDHCLYCETYLVRQKLFPRQNIFSTHPLRLNQENDFFDKNKKQIQDKNCFEDKNFFVLKTRLS